MTLLIWRKRIAERNSPFLSCVGKSASDDAASGALEPATIDDDATEVDNDDTDTGGGIADEPPSPTREQDASISTSTPTTPTIVPLKHESESDDADVPPIARSVPVAIPAMLQARPGREDKGEDRMPSPVGLNAWGLVNVNILFQLLIFALHCRPRPTRLPNRSAPCR